MKLSTKNKSFDIPSFAILPTRVYDPNSKEEVVIIFQFYKTGYWFNWTNSWYTFFITPNPNVAWRKRLYDKSPTISETK